MADMKMCPAPPPGRMMALSGNLYVPHWTTRPGSYSALVSVADCMMLWKCIHSWNRDYFKPCFYSETQLGKTIGCSRGPVHRNLLRLEKASLLFSVRRGRKDASNELRPAARWALDPFNIEEWRPRVEEMLGPIAEGCGLGTRWYRNAITSLRYAQAGSVFRVSPTLPERRI